MAPTYSINPGTAQEASSYTQIGDILNLLPDNTQKLISPRDARDAVFSNWENTVFRYTTNSSSDQYIGIARKEVVDVKLFLGKKELTGTSILNSGLISTDTDIFLYNTKSDSAPTQDLKISFLGGDDFSLHTQAPYIEVQKVSGGTPSLNFNIKHNQTYGGDFNFVASNSGRIGLNNDSTNRGLIIPSADEISAMAASPGTVSVGETLLVRTSGGLLELRDPAIVNSTIGTTGSPTNIYGSPVYVNGYSLEFTDLNPTPVDFGGIPAGSTFSNVPLSEMIRQMLYPYLTPLTSITLPTYIRERYEIGDTSTTYNYVLSKRTDDITSSNLRISSTVSYQDFAGPLVSGPGFINQSVSGTFTFSFVFMQNNTANSYGQRVFTFRVTADDGTSSGTSSQTLKFVYPYFYGFSTATPSFTTPFMNSVISNDLTKSVQDFGNQNVPLNGSGYLYFCYPSAYGALTSIYDGNGYIVTSSFTSSTVANISSPVSEWSGVSYRIYRTTLPVSIPLPTQTYEFNFT